MALDLLRRIRSFRVPGDPVVANELAQQLAKFEDNVSNMGAALLARSMAALEPLPETVIDNTSILAAGQFGRYDTSRGNLSALLTQAAPKRRGLLLVIKLSAVNTLTLYAQDGQLVDGAASLGVTSLGGLLLFCDGEGYWSL